VSAKHVAHLMPTQRSPFRDFSAFKCLFGLWVPSMLPT
jgi:hypothetical protein